MKPITLRNGTQAIVDDDLHATLSAHSWSYHKLGAKLSYVARFTRFNGKRIRIFMHREVANPKHGEIVDHKDRDTLNNQRSNLRIATASQNAQNAKRRKSRSGLIGVEKKGAKFAAFIAHKGKRMHLGMFDRAEDAARARDAKAVELHGEFSILNG